jgi:site-specific DNA recombinase
MTPRTLKQQVTRAVVYARVSSKDQEREGFSIPAQQRLLREYAEANGMVIAEEFLDVETARRTGRDGFGQMLAYLKKHEKSCQTILVEKTDRLYRNLKDWSTLDELGMTIHFVKENVVISPDAKSADQFLHGIKVLMARNYSLNLSEETIKGMVEKARAGIFPSNAPVGYKNVEGPAGKRIIIPDPMTAPTIMRLFDLFATGKFSVKTLAQYARAEGINLHGRRMPTSELHLILRRRLYMGDFDWNGVTYQGTHEPLLTRETWERTQTYLDHRSYTGAHAKRDFTFSGIVQCGHCGCLLVGERKKERYTYYHCTGNRGKCNEPYTPEATMTAQFTGVLRELIIPADIISWLQHEVVTNDQHQHTARQATIKRHEDEIKRIEARIETMYLDKLDEKITTAFYDQKTKEWRKQQERLRHTIAELRLTATEPLDQAVNLLDLTSRACDTFNDQPQEEQRRLLTTVLERATWKEGTLDVTLLEPFQTLRHSNSVTTTKTNGNGTAGRDIEIWLPRNHGFQLSLRSQRVDYKRAPRARNCHQYIHWSTDCEPDRLADTAEHFH